MTKQLVTIRELADRLRVSIGTIRVWKARGYFPEGTYVSIGNTLRFDADAVIAALLEREQERETEAAD